MNATAHAQFHEYCAFLSCENEQHAKYWNEILNCTTLCMSAWSSQLINSDRKKIINFVLWSNCDCEQCESFDYGEYCPGQRDILQTNQAAIQWMEGIYISQHKFQWAIYLLVSAYVLRAHLGNVWRNVMKIISQRNSNFMSFFYCCIFTGFFHSILLTLSEPRF